MKLCDKRTPTCPYCGMEKLELDDIIWTDEGNEEKCELREHRFGHCPNCEHEFDWIQVFTYSPLRYEGLEDVTDEDEEDEEDE
jgi:hypothetical protein